MTLQRPHSSGDGRYADDERRVVPFRPRLPAPGSINKPAHTSAASAPTRDDATNERGLARDLSRYDQPVDEPDDFRRRIAANLAVMALLIVLMGLGLWLTVTITHLRDVQDCILSGRRNCASLYPPPD